MTDKNKPNDLITINSGFGRLPVPKKILDLWNKYGWPDNAALEVMARAGRVDVPLDPYGRVIPLDVIAEALSHVGAGDPERLVVLPGGVLVPGSQNDDGVNAVSARDLITYIG